MSPDPFVFEVYDNETDARESLFENEDQTLLTVGILFDENINGLTVGSGVKYQGVRVGEVSAINAIMESKENRDASRDKSSPIAEIIGVVSSVQRKGIVGPETSPVDTRN